MLITLVGKQHMDFSLDDGTKLVGWKIHCIDKETQRSDLEGFQIFDKFLPDDSVGASVVKSAKVGQDYNAYFNNKGKLEVLLPPSK